uniref:Uncharacterized protein n=1 Tax=Mustela putorius furo TaxID=9669 RepID=M3Y705_MUSPF
PPPSPRPGLHSFSRPPSQPPPHTPSALPAQWGVSPCPWNSGQWPLPRGHGRPPHLGVHHLVVGGRGVEAAAAPGAPAAGGAAAAVAAAVAPRAPAGPRAGAAAAVHGLVAAVVEARPLVATGSPESGTGGGRLRLAARNVPEVPRPSVRPSPDGGSPRLAPRSCSEAPPDFSPRLARPRPHPIPGGIHWVAAAPRLQRGLKHAAVPKEIRPPRCLKYSPTPTSIPAHTRRMDPPGPKITPTDPDPDPSTCHGNHPSRAEMDSQPSLNVPSVTGHLPPPNMTERYQTLNTEKP